MTRVEGTGRCHQRYGQSQLSSVRAVGFLAAESVGKWHHDSQETAMTFMSQDLTPHDFGISSCCILLQSSLQHIVIPPQGPFPQAWEGNAWPLSTPASPASINSYILDHKHKTVCPNASFNNTEIGNRAYRTTRAWISRSAACCPPGHPAGPRSPCRWPGCARR